MPQRRILITGALPYANGSIHVGHLVEYLQADFWTRFQKMRGHETYYVCADDTHGTAVMVSARKRGITPEALIQEVWQEHTKDFRDFQIEFDHYSSTNSTTNKVLCEEFFSHMQKKNHLATKDVKQLYCEHDKMFLPDRFVKGTCPKCGSKDQYGDSCDVCGSTYQPADMPEVKCAVCGTPPTSRVSEHILFKLNDHRQALLDWLPAHTSREVSNKMKEWFNEPLRDWDISRDGPYFGFEIPGHPNKFFYVWVDAPMGYVSGFRELSEMRGISFDDFWRSDKGTEVYHFIGKDITYFHTLFWPALLMTAGYRTPTQVFVHGHLTLNGEKMSKSKGTQVTARTYLNHLDPTYLRYYYACKLNSSMDDLDLNLEDFQNRVNSDLVGKITNLGSRGAQMLGKSFGSQMTALDPAGADLLKRAQDLCPQIAEHYEARDFAKAIAEIRSIADDANRYFDEKAPWKLIKEDPEQTQRVLTSTLNVFRLLAILLKPILPVYTQKVERLFGATRPWQWSDLDKIATGPIQPYEHLATRIEADRVKSLMAESQKMSDTLTPKATPTTTTAPKTAPARDTSLLPEIEIDAFSKIDLRVAEIVEAEAVPEADKLLRLKISLGPLGERQIFAGIKSAYSPEKLRGRLIVVVANLKPRKMKFGMSEGMALAAGAGGSELFVVSPDSGAKPGDPVK